MNGAEAGDLYLEIAFQADDRYRVEGRDVYEKYRSRRGSLRWAASVKSLHHPAA